MIKSGHEHKDNFDINVPVYAPHLPAGVSSDDPAAVNVRTR